MKIVEKKELKEKTKWNIGWKCTGNGNGGGGCMSKLLVNEDDIFITSSEHYWGEEDFYFTFVCPVCGEKTDIPENYLPKDVKIKVMSINGRKR